MRPGDIIGIQGVGPLSDAIRALTGNGPLSHIAGITATDPFPQVTEARSRVVTRPLDVLLAESAAAWLFEPLFLNDGQRADGVKKVLGFSGHDYGWDNIALQLLDSVGHTTWYTDKLAALNEPICSMLWAYSEPEIGFNPRSVTPNGFWVGIVNAPPTKWRVSKLK